jgi:hypothetical protein
VKLKLDDKGNVVVQDGKPVYVDEAGKDVAFDVVHTINRISQLNAEAKTNREAKEAAETKLKAYDGITDAEAAKKALETVANLDAGKLVQAGKVEEIKLAAQKASQEQLDAAKKAHATELAARDESITKLQSTLNSELIGGSFSRSKFIAEKVAIPSDLVQARFGQNFKLEDGKVVAYDNAGNKVFSRAKPGDVAEFEEALELLVDQYPSKAQILKGNVQNGGGAGGGAGGAGAGGGDGKGKTFDPKSTREQRIASIQSRFPTLGT